MIQLLLLDVCKTLVSSSLEASMDGTGTKDMKPVTMFRPSNQSHVARGERQGVIHGMGSHYYAMQKDTEVVGSEHTHAAYRIGVLYPIAFPLTEEGTSDGDRMRGASPSTGYE